MTLFKVYILENPAGKFYIGQTENLDSRLDSHNSTDESEGEYTRKNGPWKLVWQEDQSSRASAMRRDTAGANQPYPSLTSSPFSTRQ